MAIPIVDHLTPDESDALASFLIEMILLEQQISFVIAEHFSPNRIEQFETVFLDRATMGTKATYLTTVLRVWGMKSFKDFNRDLQRLIAVRNAVAHSLPRMAYEDDGDDIDVFTGYKVGDQVHRAADLADLSVEAVRLRTMLGGQRG